MNMLPMSVTLDVSKLSGWLNAVARCRVERRACAVRGEVYGSARREAAGDNRASSVQRRARVQIGGRPRGGAHLKHGMHFRDAGGVEGQRLVERRRFLPRVERRAYGAVQGTGLMAAGGGRPRRTQRAGEGSTIDWEQATRGGAHPEHVGHACDAGGVEVQRLVERRRFLPRVERRAYLRCGARYGLGGGGRRAAEAHAACRREGSTADSEQGAGRSARRTCSPSL